MHSQTVPSNAFGGQCRDMHLALPGIKHGPIEGKPRALYISCTFAPARAQGSKQPGSRRAWGHPKGGLDYRIKHTSLNLDSEEIQEQAEEPILKEVCTK